MGLRLGASGVYRSIIQRFLHWQFDHLRVDCYWQLDLFRALIFAISAFEPVDDKYDGHWFYPELGGRCFIGKIMLMQKLKEAESSVQKIG